jgi:hypothetical protein
MRVSRARGKSADVRIIPRSAEDRIAAQQDLINSGEYYPLGRLYTAVFIPELMDPPPHHYVFERNKLMWTGTDRNRFPMLAVSKNGRDLLFLPDRYGVQIPHPPDIVDTNSFVKTTDAEWQSQPYRLAGGKTVMLGRGGLKPKEWPQRYSDRTRTKLGSTGYLRLGPVYQLMYHDAQIGEWRIVQVSADLKGDMMALFVNPKTQKGHLVGGLFQADSRMRKAG